MAEIEKITSAVSWYVSASASLAKALEDCETSPSYYCQRYYQAQEEARAELEKSLNEYIDERVALAIKNAV
jgi:hypothetical protein